MNAHPEAAASGVQSCTITYVTTRLPYHQFFVVILLHRLKVLLLHRLRVLVQGVTELHDLGCRVLVQRERLQ